MIKHAAAFRNRRSLHDMQHRLAVIVEPGAGKRERRALAGSEAENVVIEGDRLFSVGREDGEMIHPSDRHEASPPLAHNARTVFPPARLVASPGACQAPIDGARNLTAAAGAAHASLMDDRTNKVDGELGILARRKIEAAIIAPIYDEMRQAIGEEKARDILRRAIRRAAVDAGAEMATRANDGADLESFKAILPLWTKDEALPIE